VLELSLLNALACTVAPVFIFAITRIGAARAVIHIGAVLIVPGALLLDERIGWVQIGGTAVVLAGIAILTAPSKPSASPA
jgi:drug/metabolite transporter (DMT)-like permease